MAGRKNVSPPKKQSRRTAVTKPELVEALANHPTNARFDSVVATLATKKELELWGGALLYRIEQRIDAMFTQQRIELREALRCELVEELQRHVNASNEDMRTRIAVVDEKYAELPARVAALEERSEK